MFRFFNYALGNRLVTREDMRSQANAIGYAALTEPVAKKVLEFLRNNFTCDGKSLLAVEATPREAGTQTAIIVAGSVAFAGSVLPFLYLLFVKKSADGQTLFKEATMGSRRIVFFITLSTVTLVGCLLAAASSFAWAMVPVGLDSPVCGLRLWLTFSGIALAIGSLVSRAAQMSTVRKLGSSVQTSNLFGISLKLLRDALVLLTLELVFLGIWAGVDPLKPELVTTDYLLLEGEWVCTVSGPAFPIIQACLIFMGTMYGIVQVSMNWSIGISTSSQMWMLVAFYNNLVALTITVVLLSILRGDLAQVLVSTALVLFFSVQNIATLLIPSFLNFSSLVGNSNSQQPASETGNAEQPRPHARHTDKAQVPLEEVRHQVAPAKEHRFDDL